MVTYESLFAYTLVIIGIVALFMNDFGEERFIELKCVEDAPDRPTILDFLQ